MKKKLLLLLILIGSCQKPPEPKPQEMAVNVAAKAVKRETIPITLQFTGITQSSHSVDIWSRVQGYLNKIDYVEGALVKEGDLLFEIDAREFQSAVDEATANLEREKVNLASAEKAVARYQPLFQEKAVSRKDMEDADSQLLAEQAAVSMYQTRLDEAKLHLSYTQIRSPISGLSTLANYREGTLINPAANGLLTTIYAIDPIWVKVNVSGSYLLKSQREVAKGDLIIPENFAFDVKLTFPDGSEYPLEGKVSFVSPVLDPQTGTFSTQAVFPNPQGIIKPGQFVQASAFGAKRPNAIAIPQVCVQQGASSRFVYVIDKSNRAEMRAVETGDWIGSDWLITSGLEEGDLVIVEGVNKVENGTLVNVISNL